MILNNELVSVIITTHNRAELVGRAINSALRQTYENIEIIVVDDGSSDNTQEVLNKLVELHPKIIVLRHPEPKGGNSARNTGIKASKGNFIAGLDDDDEFLPNRISLLMENYNEGYSLITSCSRQINRDTKIRTRFIPIIDLNLMLYYNAVGNQVLVKKKYIEELGYFDEVLPRFQDYDMWLRIIERYGKARMIEEETQIIYYNHTNYSIDLARKNFLGGFAFFKKHKHLMNKNTIRVKLFLLKKHQGKKQGIMMEYLCKIYIYLQIIKSRLQLS